MSDEEIMRAAAHLDEFADGLLAGYTVAGRWLDQDDAHREAHKDYLELKDLALKLRGLVE